MENRRLPVHVVKFGKVQASIWKNDTKHGARFNVTIFRVYEENGVWKRSDSLGRDELLSAARAFQTAYDWIWTQTKSAEDGLSEEAI